MSKVRTADVTGPGVVFPRNRRPNAPAAGFDMTSLAYDDVSVAASGPKTGVSRAPSPPPRAAPVTAPATLRGVVAPAHIVTNAVGIYGWRKKCLYSSVLLLTILAIINAGLLVFLMYTLDINGSGAGPLRFKDHLLVADGRVELAQGVVVDHIASYAGADLVLEAGGELALFAQHSAPNAAEASVASLVLNEAGATIDAARVTLSHRGVPYVTADATTFRVDSQEMVFGAAAGLVVNGAVQTSRVSAPIAAATTSSPAAVAQGLTLESLAHTLSVTGGGNVTVTSTGGAVRVDALRGITLRTPGTLSLTAPSLRLLGAWVGAATTGTAGMNSAMSLCVCSASGQVYAVPASSTCGAFNPCS